MHSPHEKHRLASSRAAASVKPGFYLFFQIALFNRYMFALGTLRLFVPRNLYLLRLDWGRQVTGFAKVFSSEARIDGFRSVTALSNSNGNQAQFDVIATGIDVVRPVFPQSSIRIRRSLPEYPQAQRNQVPG